MNTGQKILAAIAAVIVAVVLLGAIVGGGDSEVEQALAEHFGGTGMLIVDDSCSHRGETASGYEHWVCVVQEPSSEFESGDTHQVDIAWNGSKIVRVER